MVILDWLAQATPPVGLEADLVKTITNLGSFAIIVYLIVYVLPKSAQKFIDSNQLLIKTFHDEMVELRKTFHLEVETVRERADARAEKIAERVGKAEETVMTMVLELRDISTMQRDFLMGLSRKIMLLPDQGSKLP